MPWEQKIGWTQDYAGYCEAFEYKCLPGRLEGMWANKSSEEMFGPSDPIRVLGELGSSRWKQRALSDAVRDAYACHRNLAVARISVTDTIHGKRIDRDLKKGWPLDPDELRKLMMRGPLPERNASSLRPHRPCRCKGSQAAGRRPGQI